MHYRHVIFCASLTLLLAMATNHAVGQETNGAVADSSKEQEKSGPLDERTFRGSFIQKGRKKFESKFIFDEGMLEVPRVNERLGFEKMEYQAKKKGDVFEIEARQTNEQGDAIRFEGQVLDVLFFGKAIYERADGKTIEYRFDAREWK